MLVVLFCFQNCSGEFSSVSGAFDKASSQLGPNNPANDLVEDSTPSGLVPEPLNNNPDPNENNPTDMSRIENTKTALTDIPVKVAPHLQGYGTDTEAGRGGQVLIITNLNDSGPGSARAAFEAEGKRQIISNVAGEIKLVKPIYVKSDASYYGQVAPGEGLTFTMDEPTGIEGIIVVDKQSDILLQYLKARGVGKGSYRNLTILNSENIVVDHGSFSWATDQNLNTWYVNKNLTFSNNLVYETFTPHSLVTLFGHTRSNYLSLHHNAFSHGSGRMPKVADFLTFDVSWNIVHNHGNWGLDVITQGESGTIKGNITNNWFQSLQNKNPICAPICVTGRVGPVEVYVAGNYHKDINSEVGVHSSADNYSELDSPVLTAPVIGKKTAKDLPETLLGHIGASLPIRDKNDARAVNEILTNSGSRADSISGEGGGSKTYYRSQEVFGNSLVDIESVDGVPDSWKVQNGYPAGTDLTKIYLNDEGYTAWENWRYLVFKH